MDVIAIPMASVSNGKRGGSRSTSTTHGNPPILRGGPGGIFALNAPDKQWKIPRIAYSLIPSNSLSGYPFR
jgi:hypothetical protein